MNNTEGDAQYSIPKLAFKAVENFFRRISFNLGNTPSETDIKIVSCIPVDVSDLQAKILCLEKELETHKKRGVKFKNSAVHTTLINQNFVTDSMTTQTKQDVLSDDCSYLRRGLNTKSYIKGPASDNQKNTNRIPSLAYDIMGIKDTKNRPRHEGIRNKIKIQREHHAYHSQVHTPLQSCVNDWNSLVENDIIRKSDNKNTKSHSLNYDTLSNLSRNNLTFNRDSLCDSDICLRPNENLDNIETENIAIDENTVVLSPKASERVINNPTTSKFYNDRYYDLIPVKIHGNHKTKAKDKNSAIASLMDELAMNKTNYKYTGKGRGCDEESPSIHHHQQDMYKRKTITDDETSKHSKDYSTYKHITNLQAQNHVITEETASNYSNHFTNDVIPVKKELKTKTDETLNEIKTILKSVVNLVKRRSSRTTLRRKRCSNLSKRDATVQKDLESDIERVRIYQQPIVETELSNYAYYPNYSCRPMEPCVQTCFVPPQHSPFYGYNPVGHYYPNDPRQLRCYPYRY